MGFIDRVKDRVYNANYFANFKRLIRAYKLVDSVNVQRPKIYAILQREELANKTISELRLKFPKFNLFTIRPSVFLSASHDFMLRDDGNNVFMDFNSCSSRSFKDIINSQSEFLSKMEEDTGLLVEEFPLTHSDELFYPTHYRVHVFGGLIGCIQVTDTNHNIVCWVDEECEVLSNLGDEDNGELENYIPNAGVMNDICQAAKAVSLATKLPYIRADFVASTKGAMFRSFSCIPGDIRSDNHNPFYKEMDNKFEEMWNNAEQIIEKEKRSSQTKGKISVNSKKPKQKQVITTPDDNI